MEWLIAVISIATVLVTILIFVIRGFNNQVRCIDEKVGNYEERLRIVEGIVVEIKTENIIVIKRLDQIESKIDNLAQVLRK